MVLIDLEENLVDVDRGDQFVLLALLLQEKNSFRVLVFELL